MIGIANTKKKQIEGMKKYKGKKLLFPFAPNSQNVITMKGMKEPLLVKDNNGTRLAMPNEELITEGEVMETRLNKKLQLGKLKKYQLEALTPKPLDYSMIPNYINKGFQLSDKQGSVITANRGSGEGTLNMPTENSVQTNLPPREYIESLLKKGYTIDQIFKPNAEGKVMVADTEGYRNIANELAPKYPTATGKGEEIQFDRSIKPLPQAGLMGTDINIPPPNYNIEKVPQTNPKLNQNILNKLKGVKMPDLENLDLGYNFADAFLNKRNKPPVKQTIAHYTPETFRPHLQPIMDAGTTNMRNVDRVRGNAMSKNANIANVAMQRAAGTNQELNRVDNLNVDLLNNAQLKNIDIQGVNNDILYNNAAQEAFSIGDRTRKQSEFMANANARIQGVKRDKNAQDLANKQLEMYKMYYAANNPETQSNTTSTNTTPNVNIQGGKAQVTSTKPTPVVPTPRVMNESINNSIESTIPNNIYKANIQMPANPLQTTTIPDLGRLGQKFEQIPFGSSMQKNFNLQLGSKLKLKFNKK